MKKVMLVTLMILAVGAFAVAQIQAPTSDVLGAHLNYGRGCAACHAPHSGAHGNGSPNRRSHRGQRRPVGSGRSAPVRPDLPNRRYGSRHRLFPDASRPLRPRRSGHLNTMTCLSCHDGNLAKGAMMKNKVYETLPATYGTYNPFRPCSATTATAVGRLPQRSPGGRQRHRRLRRPVQLGLHHCRTAPSYVRPEHVPVRTELRLLRQPWQPTTPPVVTCTTCHNQHLMNVVKVTTGSKSGLPTGYYATMFFIRAPYNPASGTAGSNQTAQFCRQCHGGEANELNNGTAPNHLLIVVKPWGESNSLPNFSFLG